MKICPICTKNQIKNSYQQCFECCKKDDISIKSDDDISSYKKETIPKTVRNCLWINYFDDSRTGKCQCCLRENISIDNYAVGHINAEINGGKTSLENLVPICTLCNTSMGRYNMEVFIKKYNLHYRLTK